MLEGYITNAYDLSPIGEEIYRQTGGYLLYEDVNMPDNNLALYFDVITSHSIAVNDNITDNWLENSTVVNDCVALSPLTVTLSGISAELVYKPGFKIPKLQQVYETIDNKLSPISAIYPPVDNITQTAKNLISVIDDNIDRYKRIYDEIKNPVERQSRLKGVYASLMTLRGARLPFVIEIPFTDEPLENMYIQSLTSTQDNQGNIMDISVTLKQLNFSEVKTTSANANVLAELNAQARVQEENKGNVQGKSGASAIGEWIYKSTGKHVNEFNT